MAVTDLLLSLIESAGYPPENPQPGIIPAFKAGTNGPLFASLMQEATAHPPSADDPSQSPGLPETGNALPELPPGTPEVTRWRARPISDAMLEDFAVTIGIERSLAKLLLNQTAAVEIAADELGGDMDSAAAGSMDTTDPADAAVQPVILPLLPPLSMPSLAAVPAERYDSTQLRMMTNNAATGITQSDATRHSPTMIADEDLMSWRAFNVRSHLGATVSGAAEAFQSTQATPNLASHLQEILPRPLSSANSILTEIGRPTSLTDEVMVTSPSAEPTLPMAATAPEPSELAGSKNHSRRTVSDGMASTLAALRVRAPLAAGMAAQAITTKDEANIIENGGLNPQVSFAPSVGVLDGVLPGAPSADPLRTDPAIYATHEGKLPDVTNAANDRVVQLPVLDQRLGFEERTRAFADAVAQRIMSQLRSENWNVSLQLEPRNLGSMDISLLLRGSELTANITMTNNEAKAILQAGLPRLQESLESHGLQLAGWSFSQSGSRSQSEPLVLPLMAQASRKQTEEDPLLTAPSAVSALQRANDTSRAVDLFV